PPQCPPYLLRLVLLSEARRIGVDYPHTMARSRSIPRMLIGINTASRRSHEKPIFHLRAHLCVPGDRTRVWSNKSSCIIARWEDKNLQTFNLAESLAANSLEVPVHSSRCVNDSTDLFLSFCPKAHHGSPFP